MSQQGSTNKHTQLFCACFSITSTVMLTMMITKEHTRLRAQCGQMSVLFRTIPKRLRGPGMMSRSPQNSRGPHCDIRPHDFMRTHTRL